MSWEFTVEGQPVSWNKGYHIVRIQRTGQRGRLRLGADGQPVDVRSIAKTDDAKAYTDLAAWRAKEAAPKGWNPDGLVVVEYRFFLGTNIDCDNVMKFINDGIQAATGVNDKWYLPRAMSKEWGLRPDQRKVIVSVLDTSA